MAHCKHYFSAYDSPANINQKGAKESHLYFIQISASKTKMLVQMESAETDGLTANLKNVYM